MVIIVAVLVVVAVVVDDIVIVVVVKVKVIFPELIVLVEINLLLVDDGAFARLESPKSGSKGCRKGGDNMSCQVQEPILIGV